MKPVRQVTVLGRQISVKSSSAPEKVQAVEAFVNGRLQEIATALKSGDAQLVLTLALLNTVEELLELRNSQELSRAAESRMQGIIEKLEAV